MWYENTPTELSTHVRSLKNTNPFFLNKPDIKITGASSGISVTLNKSPLLEAASLLYESVINIESAIADENDDDTLFLFF